MTPGRASTRVLAALAGVVILAAACGSDESGVASNGGAGGSGAVDGAASCSPGDQAICLCYGRKIGTRVCQKSGTLSDCPLCQGGAGGRAGAGGVDAGCVGTCSDGVQNCGETAVDCGGPCAACAPAVYTEADCIKAARNGSEICDDAAWKVEAPGTGLVLVCLTDAGGIIYVASNTGPPDPVDGIKRCQGWEKSGQNAWDYLAYVYQLKCDKEQQLIDLDLSSHVGQTLYFGAHENPAGGGQFTHMCLAKKK